MMRTKVTVHCDGPNCGRQVSVPPRHVTGAHHLVEAIPGWIAVALQDREEWWEESSTGMRTFCGSACLADYEQALATAIKEDTEAAFAYEQARAQQLDGRSIG